MGLDERRVVRTAVPLVQGNDLYNLGSGYLIADGLVLTAAHVLERTGGVTAQEGETVEVARLGGDWQPARVAWVDAGRDVAVVRCSGLRAEGGIRWGRLVGSDPLKWNAVGFPRASLEHQSGRQPEHAYGKTSPISYRSAGRLALTVESREPIKGDSPWAGLSGAAVFSGEYLIGIVTTDSERYARSLVGRRAEDFCADRGLGQLLGGTPELEDVGGSQVTRYLTAVRAAAREQPYADALLGAPQLTAVYLPQRISPLPPVDQASYLLQSLDPWDVVRRNHSVLITGRPGAGKSSLLRHIVETSADVWLKGGSESFVPALIHADALTHDRPFTDALAAGVAHQLSTELDDSGPLRLLEEMPASDVPWLIVVDGIDEILDSVTRSTKVLKTIVNRSNDPRYRFLLASRMLPQAELRYLAKANVQLFEIQLFSEEEAIGLARRCFEALDSNGSAGLVDRFRSQSFHGRLGELARNPLITTAICVALADDPGLEFPSSRADLYECLVKSLLGKPFTRQFNALQRLQDSIRSYGDEPQHAVGKVLDDLRPLTEFLAKCRMSRIDNGLLLDYAEEYPSCRALSQLRNLPWRRILSEVFRLDGCLFQQGEDFSFIHGTVMEYLAACSIKKSSRLRRRQKLELAIRAGRGDSYALFAVSVLREAGIDLTRPAPRLLGIRRLIHARLVAAMINEGVILEPRTIELATRRLMERVPRSSLTRLSDIIWQGEDGRVVAAKSLALLNPDEGNLALARAADEPSVGYFNVFDLLAQNPIRSLASDVDRDRGINELVDLATMPAQDEVGRVIIAKLILERDPDRGLAVIEQMIRDSTLDSTYRMECISLLLKYDRERGIEALAAFSADPRAELPLRFHAVRRLRRISPERSEEALERIAFDSVNSGLARQVASMQIYRERPSGGKRAILALATDKEAKDFHRVASSNLLNQLDSQKHLALLAADPSLSDEWRLFAAERLAMDDMRKGVAVMRDIAKESNIRWRVRGRAMVNASIYRHFDRLSKNRRELLP